MWEQLNKIKNNLVIAIPISMVVGILYGFFYKPAPLKVLILPLTIGMIYPMMVTINIKTLFSECKPKAQLSAQLINFIVIPVVGYLLGRIFLKDNPYQAYGLLLIALLPTSGMTISWTGFAKGDVNVAVKATMIGLVLGSLLMPFYTKFFMGRVISLPLAKTFIQLGKVIFFPLFLGLLTQVALKKTYGEAAFNKDIKKKFPLLATLAVLGIIFVAMALKAKSIVAHPAEVFYLLIPLAIFYTLSYALASVVGKYFFDRANAIALVYSTVMRNLSVALAIAFTVFGEKGVEIALIVAVAYIVQVQSAAWYINLADKIFGPAPEDTAKDVMEEGVFALHDDATLLDAIRLLDEEHIHSLAVLDKEETPLGIITAEMIINLLAEDVSKNEKLEAIKLLPALSFRKKDSLEKVIKAMRQEHEYKVLIVDADNRVEGVITKTDILRKLK